MFRAVVPLLILVIAPAWVGLRAAETVAIAAAANLIYVMEPLKVAFNQAQPDVRLKVTTGASGNLFAQIQHGAPFDVFLSADTEYPHQLVGAKLGDGSTLRTFAVGRLVAWTMHPELEIGDLRTAIRSPRVQKIAIAQPKTAPYGRAAQAALEKLGVRSDVERKLVIGESITQTAQFVETGNADLGFVALSLVLSPKLALRGHWVEVPRELYAGIPLDHAVVLTNRGARNAAAKRFLDFLQSDAAKKILRTFGYGSP